MKSAISIFICYQVNDFSRLRFQHNYCPIWVTQTKNFRISMWLSCATYSSKVGKSHKKSIKWMKFLNFSPSARFSNFTLFTLCFYENTILDFCKNSIRSFYLIRCIVCHLFRWIVDSPKIKKRMNSGLVTAGGNVGIKSARTAIDQSKKRNQEDQLKNRRLV